MFLGLVYIPVTIVHLVRELLLFSFVVLPHTQKCFWMSLNNCQSCVAWFVCFGSLSCKANTLPKERPQMFLHSAWIAPAARTLTSKDCFVWPSVKIVLPGGMGWTRGRSRRDHLKCMSANDVQLVLPGGIWIRQVPRTKFNANCVAWGNI